MLPLKQLLKRPSQPKLSSKHSIIIHSLLLHLFVSFPLSPRKPLASTPTSGKEFQNLTSHYRNTCLLFILTLLSPSFISCCFILNWKKERAIHSYWLSPYDSEKSCLTTVAFFSSLPLILSM